MTVEHKAEIKRKLAECLGRAPEIQKVMVFGSFLRNEDPNDIDVAVFVDNDSDYLPLTLKLRQLARPVSDTIPLDIIPVRPGASGAMYEEICGGEVIYER
jgi:predicted nucleotidyltransferase